MDNLTRYLLGKYGNVLRLRSEVLHQAVLDARSDFDLEKHIKQSMAQELARKLLDSKSAAFSESRVDGTIVFGAKIIALTEDEITAIVNTAYEAGIESTGVHRE